jgi:hypothetical protein
MKYPLIVPHYLPRILLCASILLLFALPYGRANAANEYEVDNIVVDSDGKDTTDARTKALQKGEKDAFSQLILRLNPPNAAQIFAQVTPAQVNGAMRGYTVIDEKMTADHYHATLNYTFDPRQIQALAPPPPAPQPAVLPVSPAPATSVMMTPSEHKAVLILPVYSQDNALELWQDDNKWRTLWYDAALESGGGLVIVPLGDINDRVDVDDGNVNAATPESLKRMYDRYAVGQIDVVQAFFNPKADPKPTLEVTLKKLLPGKPETVQISYIIHANETLEGLLTRASNDIARTLYKQQTIDPNKIEFDRIKEISARINTNSIQEWQALRQRLLMRSNIVDIKFVSISYYETNMIISFKGTADMLGKTLVASGLRVMQDGDRLVLSLK